MVNKRSISGMVAAFTMFLAVPAMASAHTLALSAGPSQCVTPLNGQYTATITVTETYFGGTTENIPVGQNVLELPTSSDHGNTGLNQNYFTQGAVGTQTGPVNLGQPTSFTSPSNGSAATQRFTVTTSTPETYVLGNSYMRSPASVTISAPTGGCTPPPPSCSSGQTMVNGTCVPPAACPADQTLSGNVCVPITSCSAGQSLMNGHCVPPTTCPAGQVLMGGQCVPPTVCPSGQTLSGGQCVPPTVCPAGETLTGGVCAKPTVTAPAVCRASTKGYKVRARQRATIVVSVVRQGVAVADTSVTVTLPNGRLVTKTTAKNGNATFVVTPTRSGTIYVHSPSCQATVKVKVLAAKVPTVHRTPAYTG
jgi:hypothetical protein